MASNCYRLPRFSAAFTPLLIVGCGQIHASAKDRDRTVAIVAYDGTTRKAAKVAQRALAPYVVAEIVDGGKLPADAFYPPRNRYRADRLLKHLQKRDEWRAIGLTSSDISTTSGKYKDWGVLGLGYMPGRAAVVSSYRLRGSFDRLRKVVVHEFGHTLGLPHCPTPRCVMNDAKGSIKTVDRETGRFCKGCAEAVEHALD